MTTPTPYTRYRDYSQFQADNPDTEINGSDLDTDFDRVKTTTDSLATSLATIRRDDGGIKNGVVTIDSLSTDALTTLALDATVQGDWAASTAYVAGDVVRHGDVETVGVGIPGAGTVNSLANLKALDVPSTDLTIFTRYRTAAGDMGGAPWVWRSGNRAANVTADTGGNFWAAPTDASTGASGAWQRAYGYVNTTDADALTWATAMSGTMVNAVEGNYNGYISVVVNNLSAAAVSFPTAITGVAYQKGTGNVAFSAYLESILSAAGIVTAEFGAFQKSAPAPNAYPFTDSLGTTQHIAKALQLTAGTQSVSFTGDTSNGSTTISNVAGYVSPAAVGSVITGTGIARNTRVTVVGAGTLTISKAATATGTTVALTAFSAAATGLDFLREGSTNGVFNFGMTTRAGAILSYIGYFDATSSLGADNGIYLAIPGDVSGNSHLILKTMSAGVAANKVIDVQDSSGTTQASIRQDGKVNATSYQVAGVELATMSGAYSLLKAADGSVALSLGGSGDQSNFYDNTQHVFRSILGGATFATVDTNGITIASGKVLKVGSNQVVAARDTGWTAMTGSTDKATAYDTTTVTLPQLAGRVMALQAALTTHGLLGA